MHFDRRPVCLLHRIFNRETLSDRSHCRRGARRIRALAKAHDRSAVDMKTAQRQRLVCFLERRDRLPERGRQPTA
jgi:hypothetical protein